MPGIHAQTGSQFDSVLSASSPVTITVTGQGSKWVEPDQVTISLDLQSKLENSSSFALSNQNKVQQFADAIRSALPGATVSLGEARINPQNTAQSSASLRYQSYSLVHATTDMTTFEGLATSFDRAGLSIQDANIMQVPSNQTHSTNVTRISISAGSSNTQGACSSTNCYDPPAVNISTGDIVTWTNDDRVGHTVTSGSPSDAITGSTFDSSLIPASKEFSHTFLSPGTFEYYCQVHPWMTGTVTVAGNSLAPTGQEGAKYKVGFSIPVNTMPDTLGNTTKQYRDKIDTIRGILNAGGISDSDISIDPLRINSANYGPQVASQYDVSNTINVNANLGELSKVVAMANNAGANIETITMSVSQKRLDSAKQDMVEQALDDALAQASSIAQSSGLAVKSIKDIQLSPLESQNNQVQYGRFPFMEIQPSSSGQFFVTATVQFEIGK